MTLACYTAIKLSGWDHLKTSVMTLYESYVTAREQITKDLAPELDEDGDGEVSATEIVHALKKKKILIN
eukprot:UN27692